MESIEYVSINLVMSWLLERGVTEYGDEVGRLTLGLEGMGLRGP